ncbi:MAG: NADH oxidase, partial [Sphingomonadales bacterium]
MTELTGLELRSTISSDGALTLHLEPVTLGTPGPDEVIVRVEATPINPSDLGLLLGPADMATLKPGGTSDRPTLTAAIPQARMAAMKPRL